MKQILVNLQIKPQKISADTIYLTLANLQYLEELDIVEKLMSTKEWIKDYKLSPNTVEVHNGTIKRIYNYDNIPIVT